MLVILPLLAAILPRGRNIHCKPFYYYFPQDINIVRYRNTSSETSRADSNSDDEERELLMPQTPALDTSSITPNTSGSQLPITPTSCDDNQQSIQPRTLGETGTPMNRSDRDLDPTTLFVGGLEMFGPGAWNEEKVKNFFARFGGLESVKVVRPCKFFWYL
jgi:hypothetical protein